MNRFARSWSLFKSTLEVFNADKELVWFPILAAGVTILVSILMFAIGLAVAAAFPTVGTTLYALLSDGGDGSLLGALALFAGTFLYLLVMYFIGNYFMTGLAGAALMRFAGQDPSFGDGIRIANSRLGSIFGFSVIAATVGVVLSALRGRGNSGSNVGGQIAAAIGGAAWSVVTFLVIPVIAATGAGAIDSIKQSGSLLRKTWGEQIIGSGGIGLVFSLAIVAEIALTGLLAALVSGSVAAVAVVLALGVLGFVLLAVLSSALSGIYKAAVYEYAVRGDVAEQFDAAMIAGAFHAKAA